MKFQIKHETRNRMRIHMLQKRMTYRQADIFLYYLEKISGVKYAKVYERTCDAIIFFDINRKDILKSIAEFEYEKTQVPEEILKNSGRELNARYKEKLIGKVFVRCTRKIFVPAPIRSVFISYRACKYIVKGAKCLWNRKIEVPVLDAAAIGVSVLRKDFSTASSVMFLLGIGELLEEWTHKKSVGDLARTMSLNVEKVWMKKDGQEICIPVSDVRPKDEIVVRMGNIIPFDGNVISGEAMVNQASLTGESLAVRKKAGSSVFAGTVLEEGELLISVRNGCGSSRYENIVNMIEESEKLKSTLEGKAEHLADKLVPYTLIGTGLVYLLTKNLTKALSVLMVDFSCALKLAMPISVLSAIREAGSKKITVKGGKFLEAIAEADTIVFDKTGTLTKAKPTVAHVIPFMDQPSDELLRIAACMEEHFPHSMAKAVVNAAKEKGLAHEEMHSKVEYIVAHGISTQIADKKTIIGSYHFVFEDEKCQIPEGKEELFKQLPEEYSYLYLAIERKLAAVICIEDPLREEATEVIKKLKETGISKVVMMTGDSERTAKVIAEKVGVDEYYSEVLPEDKASFVEKERLAGRKVIMIGDGINDSPALSAADVGIAVHDGAALAKEIADITIEGENLVQVVTLKQLSIALMKRIRNNYRNIVGINTALIILGVGGVIMPTTSALLHNTSTLFISLESMKPLLE